MPTAPPQHQAAHPYHSSPALIRCNPWGLGRAMRVGGGGDGPFGHLCLDRVLLMGGFSSLSISLPGLGVSAAPPDPPSCPTLGSHQQKNPQQHL